MSLFSSYTLNNGVEIKNRLVVAPMTHLGSNPDGTLRLTQTVPIIMVSPTSSGNLPLPVVRGYRH